MRYHSTTLEILLGELFDYSGMFPPEAKSLDDALTDSAKFPQSLTRPWLVHTDFVLSLSDLWQVTTDRLRLSGFSEERVFRCAVLGSTFTGDIAPFFSEVQTLLDFNGETVENRPAHRVSSFEVRLGAGLIPSHTLIETLEPLSSAQVSLFLEPDLSVLEWEEILSATADAISPYRERIGLKFRGTGPTGINNARIAAVLQVGAHSQLHLKATGGMHHPILEDRYKNSLGFLNLATALALLRSHGKAFSLEDAMRCLNESDSSSFSFGLDLKWRGHSISIDELRHLHTRHRFSIGSCSLREPDEDLLRLFGAP